MLLLEKSELQITHLKNIYLLRIEKLFCSCELIFPKMMGASVVRNLMAMKTMVLMVLELHMKSAHISLAFNLLADFPDRLLVSSNRHCQGLNHHQIIVELSLWNFSWSTCKPHGAVQYSFVAIWVGKQPFRPWRHTSGRFKDTPNISGSEAIYQSVFFVLCTQKQDLYLTLNERIFQLSWFFCLHLHTFGRSHSNTYR